LAPKPKVLLLDEPLSALALKLRKEMQIELNRLQQETGITFVFVPHDQEEALTMSDRIAVMSAGLIQQVGPPREIYTRPANRFVASFIGETNFLAGISDGARVRLGNGAMLDVAAPRGPVGLAIRPEQVRVVAADTAGAIPATVASTVYFGTDTHVHVTLSDGTEVVARQQSPAAGGAEMPKGTPVGVVLTQNALQVMGD
jgi:spermidine/putrescine transport system ATP-binding protein